MNQAPENQKPVVEPALRWGGTAGACPNNNFDEPTMATQYHDMCARSIRLTALTALSVWTALSFSGLGQPTGPKQKSPEARWGKEIHAFETADKTNPPPKDAVLFVGSSSIRLWKNLAQAFPGHECINRGFGGSQLSDSVAFADRIVMPYRPKLIVLYAGDNDIAGGKTPGRILADFKAFAEKVHAGLPQTRIAYIAIKPCPLRERFLPQVKATNSLIRDYTATDDHLLYVDIFTPMLNQEGRPRADLCLKDGLHPNAQCYEVWASILRPILDKYDAPGNGGR
jgi:lysophospholipase L1-like esterase